jgi:hypothetical protein
MDALKIDGSIGAFRRPQSHDTYVNLDQLDDMGWTCPRASDSLPTLDAIISSSHGQRRQRPGGVYGLCTSPIASIP